MRLLVAATLVLAAGCAAPITTAGTSSAPVTAPASALPAPATSPTLDEPRCELAALRAINGDAVSPETGEHPVSLDIVNTGPAACWLMGYPRLRISDPAGRPLPLVYNDGGGYVTPNPPAAVSIAPGGHASVVFANYRCDLGDKDTGTSIEISFPDAAGSITAEALGDRPTLEYCGPNDPGDVVDVSPVEPDIVSALLIPPPPPLPNSFPPGAVSK
jgi:Domain of unknown function (DUF4232)